MASPCWCNGRVYTNPPALPRWCFSTLGCPELNLTDALALADAYGFAAIEIRALQMRLDLPEYFAEHFGTPANLGHLLTEHRARAVCLNSSLRMTNPEGRDEFIRYATWADGAGIPALRAFDGGEERTHISDDNLEAILDTLDWWEEEKKRRGMTTELWIETHWSLCTPESCLKLVEQSTHPVRFIWDVFHTWRQNGRDPLATWKVLKPHIAHVHFKDGILVPGSPKGAHHTALGEGAIPLGRLFEQLSLDGFSGAVSLEWERYWNPTVPPLEAMLEKGKSLGFW